MDLKEVIPSLNKPVVYKGDTYILSGSIVRKDKSGSLFYQAEIKSLKANSVRIIKLEDIKCEY